MHEFVSFLDRLQEVRALLAERGVLRQQEPEHKHIFGTVKLQQAYNTIQIANTSDIQGTVIAPW